MEKIPFSPPRIDQEIVDEVTAALRSGWITTGPRTKALEAEVEAMTGVTKAFCVNSCTAGMELMLRWFGVGPGDEVIVPAYTYCATANVVMHCGAKPVMVDVRPEDATIDPQAVAAAITPHTKAIMPVDLGGMPAVYDELWEVVETHKNLFQATTPEQEQLGRPLMLTDAAHSLGAIYQGKSSAQQADATVFSFHAVKNVTTAEGGAICLNLPSSFDVLALYRTLNTQSLHGQSKDALAKFGKNSWEYDVHSAGFKCNMPDVLAAIGLVEIKRYTNDTLPKRIQLFEDYQQFLKPMDWAQRPFAKDEHRQSSAHLYLLRIKDFDLEFRNAMIQRIFDQGVSVNVHYKPLPLLSFYKNLGYHMGDFPVACDWWQRVITLPIFYDLQKSQVERVAAAVKKAYHQQKTSFHTLPLHRKS
ncbi:MAG: DegT/DnrJ/EryC1/StrS family aminotransferase [Bacteroidota bacterium]